MLTAFLMLIGFAAGWFAGSRRFPHDPRMDLREWWE